MGCLILASFGCAWLRVFLQELLPLHPGLGRLLMSRHVAIQVLERQTDFLQSIEEAGQCQQVERGTDECATADTNRTGDAVLPSMSNGTPALDLPPLPGRFCPHETLIKARL